MERLTQQEIKPTYYLKNRFVSKILLVNTIPTRVMHMD